MHDGSTVELGVVVCRDDPNFQNVISRFDAGQRPLGSLEHAGDLAVDISVNVLAALAFDQLEVQRNLIAAENLIAGRSKTPYLGACRGRQGCSRLTSRRLVAVTVQTVVGRVVLTTKTCERNCR
jgi:hypothetical protein